MSKLFPVLGIPAGQLGSGFDVFLIIGQSNAIGTNTGQLVVGVDDVVDPLIKTVHFEDATVVLRDGVDPLHHQQWAVNPGLFANSVGFGVKFGRLYAAATGRNVLLVPAAYGGTSIANWLPSGATAPDYFSPAVAKLQAVLAGVPGSFLKGVLWHQMEGDQSNDPTTYATRLDSIVAYFRSNYPLARFIVGGGREDWMINGAFNQFASTESAYISASIINCTAPTGHGLTTSNTVTVTWDGGRRTGVAIAAASDNSLTLGSAGTGDSFVNSVGMALTIYKEGSTARAINNKLIAMPGVAGNVNTAFWYSTSISTDGGIHFTRNEQIANGQKVYDAYVMAAGNVAGVLPAQVTGLAPVTIGAKSFRVTWNHPASRVTKFQVKYRIQGSPSWTTVDTGSRDCFWSLWTATPNSIYEVQVFATNETGDGPVSNTLTVVVDVPNAPTGLTVGTPTTSQVPLTWTAPASGAILTDYVVQYKESSSGTWLTFSDGISTTASTTVSGLTHSTSYDFRVAASNASGTGSYSNTVTVSTAIGVSMVWDTATAEATLGFATSNRTCIGFISGSGGFRSCKATIAKSTGKWYFENATLQFQGSSSGFFIGICNNSAFPTPATLGQFIGSHIQGAAFYYATSSTFRTAAFTLVNELTGVTRGAGHIYQIAFDADAGKAWFGLNGTWLSSGNPAAGTNPWLTWTPGISISPAITDSFSGLNSPQMTLGSTQTYLPPSGFGILNG